MRRTTLLAVASILAVAIAGCAEDNALSSGVGETSAPAASSPDAPALAIPWFQGGIEEAFARARIERKPLFIYWGAEWCPYCKKLQATIFVRDEFVRLSRQFVPVDMSNGDSQTLLYADRYKVYGLPTVIVFSPAGKELTRIPGAMDMDQYAAVLELTLNDTRPVAELVTAALAGGPLEAADWQLLSSYSWQQDRGQALGDEHPSTVLLALASAVPAGDELIRSRLSLAALGVWLGESEETRDPSLAGVHLAAAARILADGTLAQANMMTLAGLGPGIVELAEGEQQAALQRALLALYQPAIEDERLDLLNRADLLASWAEVATALLVEDERLDPEQVSWGSQQADGLIDNLDTYQLHAGVYSLWGVYYDLGLETRARETLTLGIERSTTPFYFMSGMGYVEMEAGNSSEALTWYRRAWEATSRPSDRVRWGSGYVRRLLTLSPDDTLEVQRSGSILLRDIVSQTDGLDAYQRSLERLGAALLAWSGNDEHRRRVVQDLHQQMESHCDAVMADGSKRAICESFLNPGSDRSAMASS